MRSNALVRNNRIRARRALGLLIVAVLAGLGYTVLTQSSRRAAAPAVPSATRPLPDDVEMVLKGYSYHDNSDGLKVELVGKRAVTRGKLVLGLRSNAIKSNQLFQVRGKLSSTRGTVTFSAREAVWDAAPDSPVTLTRNAELARDGKPFPGVKLARLYLKQRVVEVVYGENRVARFEL